ncbi:hypothetical protein HNR07_003137 [Nocardiopsis metallicus]|uniref:Uncharacterized protein n=1 Tax=Nocardiopsis metallicus TaxID=179819 RepID=A0A840W4W2_9ACTN|nr:hypothetical protein [Nocardiopsis metallicus]
MTGPRSRALSPKQRPGCGSFGEGSGPGSPQTARTGLSRVAPLALFDLDNTLADRAEGLRS